MRPYHSDTEEAAGNERVFFSGPLNGSVSKKPGKRSAATFNIKDSSSSNDNQESGYVEITLDYVGDDTVAVHSARSAAGSIDSVEDPELNLLAKGLEKKTASTSSLSVVRNASARIRQVSQEFKRLASFSKKPTTPTPIFDRTKSAAVHALKGLKFISKTDVGAGWASVEKRFDDITAFTDGLLPRSRFCECNVDWAGNKEAIWAYILMLGWHLNWAVWAEGK